LVSFYSDLTQQATRCIGSRLGDSRSKGSSHHFSKLSSLLC
jgi:hypothetical protein